MKLLFILDPLDSLKTYKDTSIAIMREAAQRGHTLYVCGWHDIILRQDKIQFLAAEFKFSTGEKYYQLGDLAEVGAHFFDVVINRKDPPFDNEYLYLSQLLAQAQAQGTRVLNNPSALATWNEKLSIARFAQFAPPFVVTSDNDLIRDFLAQHQDIIVKPLDGMGGSGIFRLTQADPNISAILETSTQFGTRTIMAQQYLPAIKEGDKRILVINGEPLPYALARIPKAGETRGNLAAGGTGVAQPLSARDLEIASTVGKVLKNEGLFLVGLDVIGDYLTEINVTSPTCMVEISAQTNCKPAQIFIHKLESSIN